VYVQPITANRGQDFHTMNDKLENNEYESLASFVYDVRLIVSNCLLYNKPSTRYAKCANALTIKLDSLLETIKARGWQCEERAMPPVAKKNYESIVIA